MFTSSITFSRDLDLQTNEKKSTLTTLNIFKNAWRFMAYLHDRSYRECKEIVDVFFLEMSFETEAKFWKIQK